MVLCFSMATYNVWIFVFFIPEYSKIQFWYRAFYWNNTAIRIGLERTAFIFSNSSYYLPYFQSGSLSHPAGKPIAATSTLGWASSNDFNCCLKSLPGWVAFCKYDKQQSWAYNRLLATPAEFIQSPLRDCGNCGWIGYVLFHVLEWWAKLLRRVTALLHQLSSNLCCGRLNSRAILFFILLSDRLQKIRDNVPKETTSRVFQAGGIIGVEYLSKCSWMKSSFERKTSCWTRIEQSVKIFLSVNKLLSIIQNAP